MTDHSLHIANLQRTRVLSPGLVGFRDAVLCTLLVSVFTLPRTLQAFKIGMLGILLVFFLIHNRHRVSFYVLCGVYASLFLFPLVVGILDRNTIGYIINVIRIEVFFPILLLLIMQQFEFSELRRLLDRSALISIVLILVIFLSSLLNAFGLFPVNFNGIFYPDEGFVGIHEGYLHVVNSSLSYLIFIIPLFFVGKKFSVRRYETYLFFIMLLVTVISGRRVILLPFLLILLLNLKRIFIPLVVVLLVGFLVIDQGGYDNFQFDTIVNRFKDALEEGGDSEVRGDQSDAFNKYIERRPLTGYGLGSYMHDFIRDPDMPINYEKTVDYQFFSLGIPITVLHYLFYLVLMAMLWKNPSLKEVDKSFRSALGLSVISLLAASSTNPYWLSTFDYCLPLALLMRFSQSGKTIREGVCPA